MAAGVLSLGKDLDFSSVPGSSTTGEETKRSTQFRIDLGTQEIL